MRKHSGCCCIWISQLVYIHSLWLQFKKNIVKCLRVWSRRMYIQEATLSNYSPLSKADIREAEVLFEQVIIPQLSRSAVLHIRDCSNQARLHIRGGVLSDRQFKMCEELVIIHYQALEANPHINSTQKLHRTLGSLDGCCVRTPHDDRIVISGLGTSQKNQNVALWLAQMIRRISEKDACKTAGIGNELMDFGKLHRELSSAMKRLPHRPPVALE